MSPQQRTPPASAVNALIDGRITVEGRMPWSTNYTFLTRIEYEDTTLHAIYKPEDGERPLDDFAPGLYKREIACYELAGALGWPLIPPTVHREDAPLGRGSLQLFVPAVYDDHYFVLFGRPEMHDALLDIAVFDVIVNNADRKAGHCLLGKDGVVYAIDNGLTFHEEPKLRTVIWDFAAEPVRDHQLGALQRIRNDLPKCFSALLTEFEISALLNRIDVLLAHPVLPEPHSERQFPWPLV